MRHILLTAAATFAVMTMTACVPKEELERQNAETADQQAPPPSTPETNYADADIDLFTLAIEAGRWNVIIERAEEGLREAPMIPGADEDMSLRIDRSLKTAAAELLILRNRACAEGHAAGAACDLGDWPAWTSEAPTAITPPSILQQRSDWLGAALSDLSGIGCDAGRTATGDDMFCSVE